jgi:hypothetical protein
MKLILSSTAILLAAITLSFASAEKSPDRPSGISAGHWVPLGDRLGVAISDYQPSDFLGDCLPRGQCVSPPVASSPNTTRPFLNGYFMVKQDGRWTRLSVVPPPEVLREAASTPKD